MTGQASHIEHIIAELEAGTPRQSLAEAKLQLTAVDRQRLKEFRQRVDILAPGFLDSFYQQLLSSPEESSHNLNYDVIEQLYTSQEQFIACLIDEYKHDQCAAERKQILGLLRGLEFEGGWLLSAYSSLIDELRSRVIQEYHDDTSAAMETFSALMKIVSLDLAIMSDINIDTERSDTNLFLQAIIQNTADGLIATDKQGTILFCNLTLEDMFGYTAQEMCGENIARLMPEKHAAEHDGYINRYIHSSRSKVLGVGMREVKGRHKQGTEFSLDISISEMVVGKERVFIGILRDCSERKKEEMQMRKLSRALDQSADSVVITNYMGIIEYVNPAFVQVTGFNEQEALGNKPNIVKSGLQEESYYKNLWNTILKGEVFRDILINRKKDGTIYYEEKTITPLFDAQTAEITHFISTGKDITERMQAQKRLHHLAYYDLLTDLPNRTLFHERLNSAITRAKRHERLLAVLLVNLDRFKIINDTLGHEVGDALLVELAKRLKKLLRQEDTVAHLSGDNFAILLEEVANVEDIPELVQKTLKLIDAPFTIHDRELYTTASIGVSLYPQDGRDHSSLMRNAEVAMYRVKSCGRNNYQFYTADMNARALKRLEMETSLRKALERKEFMVYYQPQVELVSGRIIGFEALLRWQHPELGLVMPNEFIPLLEETGLIIQASQWILEQACLQNQEWRRAGLPHVRVSVNLSAMQFRQRSLASDIADILSKTDLPPTSLQLEVTESCIMHNEANVQRTLRTFRQMGVQLAIDDFGTGYSSLSYLKKIPVNILKIDKSFVDGLPSDNSDIGIARAVIAMAHRLGMKVVAEGVEREEQLNFLHEEGCDFIQGYLFSRPIPDAAVPGLLGSGKML